MSPCGREPRFPHDKVVVKILSDSNWKSIQTELGST
jgi:hypothetical protein